MIKSKIARWIRVLPYFAVALMVVFSSIFMPVSASAANVLIGYDDSVSLVPKWEFDEIVPSGYFYCGPYDDYDLSSCTVVLTDGSVVSDLAWEVSGTVTTGSASAVGYSFDVAYIVIVAPGNPDHFSPGVYCVEYSMEVGENVEIASVHFGGNSSTGVLDVAGGVGSWLLGALGNAMEMFYAEGALTFLGYLAVAGLAFSVIFLIIGLVSRFLKFGG